MKRYIEIFISCFIAIMAYAFIEFAKAQPEEIQEPPKWSATELLRNQHREELTDWQMLIMAIAWTESKFNPAADSGVGDNGCLQLREIYIAEVNRLYGTTYTIEDAYDIDKSLDMFEKMQLIKNPTRNLEQAVYYHNKSPRYLNKVRENLELIRRYETFRAKLIER